MVVRGRREMTLTEVHTKDGKHAVRIRSTSNIAQVGNEVCGKIL